MSALAVKTGAINLGQGFPDTDGPREIAELAIAAIRDGITNTHQDWVLKSLETLFHITKCVSMVWSLTLKPKSS